jgi:uncharacterized repeat protein (TIGR03803 family)
MDSILSSAVRFHPERGAQTGVASARVRNLPRAAHGQIRCVEIEIGVMVDPYLDHPIPDKTTVIQADRRLGTSPERRETASIDWVFTVDRARQKLGRAYPTRYPGRRSVVRHEPRAGTPTRSAATHGWVPREGSFHRWSFEGRPSGVLGMDSILSSVVRFHPERGAQTGVASARVRDLPAPRTGQMVCLAERSTKLRDGYHPYGSLARGPDGKLYGVTQTGGSPPVGIDPDHALIPGYGVLFSYDPATQIFTILHTFCSATRASDGEYPMGVPAVDASGNVYGTAKGGGSASTGTVRRYSPDGSFMASALPGETRTPPSPTADSPSVQTVRSMAWGSIQLWCSGSFRR